MRAEAGDERLEAKKGEAARPGDSIRRSDFKTIRTEGLYYAADPFVPDLAKDTTLHLILFQFKGTDLVRLEDVAR